MKINKKHVITVALFILLFIIIYLADYFTKEYIRDNFAIGETIEVIGDNVMITHIKNSGIAFGLHFPGIQYLSYFAFIAVLWLLISYVKTEKPSMVNYVAFIMIISGAIGNLVDRFINGSVADMIMVGIKGHYWPIFNIADIAVTVGVTIFLLAGYIENRKEQILKEKGNIDA